MRSVLLSFLFYRWSNWDLVSQKDLSRVTQKVAEPGLKSRVRCKQDRLPDLQVKVLSLGDPMPPLTGIMSHFFSCLHPVLHLSSWCHSHRSWLSSYPSYCILTLTSSLPVVEGNISLVAQHNVAGSGFTCPGGSNPGPVMSSVRQTCFLIFLGLSFLCKMGMIIIYLLLL